MSMRKSLALTGLSLAKQAAQVFGLGPYTSAFMQGVGCAAGASLPYAAGALVLSAIGMKRAAGLVCIAGAFDMSPMEVLSEAQDTQYEDWIKEYYTAAYQDVWG